MHSTKEGPRVGERPHIVFERAEVAIMSVVRTLEIMAQERERAEDGLLVQPFPPPPTSSLFRSHPASDTA